MSKSDKPNELPFEESLLQLDKTVRQLEDGQLGLEESLACYEEGVGLIKQCYEKLRQAEQRILTITGVGDEGEPILQSFEHEATNRKKPAPSGNGDTSSRIAEEARKRRMSE